METQRQLVEVLGRLEENLQRLSEAFIAHRQEFLEHRREFLEYRAQTDRRLDRVEARLDRLSAARRTTAGIWGELKSMRLEVLYRENSGLFRSLLRRAAVLPASRRLEILEEVEAAGRITREETDQAAPLDLRVERFRRREDRRVYLRVEISWLGSTEDVARAAERAGVFARALGAEVIPMVAAKGLTAPARRAPGARSVVTAGGRAFTPIEIPTEEEPVTT